MSETEDRAVAWRWKDASGLWQVTTDKDRARRIVRQLKWPVEPLFASYPISSNKGE